MRYIVKNLVKMAVMLFWRILLNYRLKTLAVIFFLSILLIIFGLIYHVVNTNAFSRHRHRSVLDKGYRNLHSKYKDSKSQNTLEIFREDLMFANLLTRKPGAHQNKGFVSPVHMEMLTNYLRMLYPVNWDNALETDEVALDLKYLLIDSGLESNISCKQIDNMVLGGPVMPTKTKYVDYAYKDFSPSDRSSENGIGADNDRSSQRLKPEFVIKSTFRDLDAMRKCWKQTRNASVCGSKTNYRLLREVIFLSTLRHPGILLMKGYCLRGDQVSTSLRKKGQIIVTEVGVPFSDSLLAACSWSQRVSMALQVVNLLQYLEDTPFGNLWFKKLSISDFVLVRGTIVKLADLDDLELGNVTCTKDWQCETADKKGGLCRSGFCEGLNAAINLQHAATEVLIPLLQDASKHSGVNLFSKLSSLHITTNELVDELQLLFSRHPPEGPVQYIPSISEKKRNKAAEVDDYYHRKVMEREKIRGRNNSIIFSVGGKVIKAEVMSNFIRHNSENFAGLYDYPCAESQVSWGCVFNVFSVADAARMCLKDPLCQCFVVFSKNPDTESSMTVILKNGTDSTPLVFSGTTLYIRQDKHRQRENGQAEDDNSVERNPKQYIVSSEISSSGVKSCLNETLEIQQSFRRFQEKKLMTYLGLKGINEKTWKGMALRQILEGHNDLIKAEGKGGQFLVNFENNSPDNTAKMATNIKFISEDGPDINHLAYAVVYQLDRILGLYRTPPCVGRRLSTEIVESYGSDPGWYKTFKSSIASDGTLSGVMVASVPESVRKVKVTLEPLSHMTPAIVPFTDSNKSQLEYILLLWLSRMELSRDGLAHKADLILFDADRAFSSQDVDMSAYLHHCQFPINVFLSLKCFRCGRPDKKTGQKPHVCSLGEEVIRRTRTMFAVDSELFIHGYGEEDLAIMINMAATSALHIIDACITTFDSSSVLY